MIAVSVIVATYRREKELARALDSLEKQTFRDFEIIVVDDNDDKAWNDSVARIVDNFVSRSAISLHLIVNHPNLGSAETRNKGIAEAKGRYITFLDDDDLYMPEKINNQYKVTTVSGADYSLTDLRLFNEDDSIRETRKRKYLQTEESNNLLLCHLKYHMTGTDTMMFKANYLRMIGGFDFINVGDEYYLMMKAIQNNGKFTYVPYCDVKAYVHTGECGLSSGQGKIDGENKLYEFKKQFFGEINKKDIRYIKMRHYAVLAFANKRIGNNWGVLKEGTKAFLSSPISAIVLILHQR